MKRLFALILFVCAVRGAAEHQVLPKATVDHPQFANRSHVLKDGSVLAYYVRPGAASRPMLVLVPETNGDRAQFFEPTFLAGLSPELPVVIVESRGQGRSWPPPAAESANIERYADDVLEVIGVLRPAAWFIGGHSLGGMIALEIGGRKPGGLRGVIALEGWVHSRVQRDAFPETAAKTQAQRTAARQQREERYRSQRWSNDEIHALGRVWTAWTQGEKIMREIEYPVLSVWGDRGLAARPERSRLLLPDKPNITLVWIAGADHYLTDPPFAAVVAASIVRFISTTDSRSL